MKDKIFAICEYGSHEDAGILIFEINSNQKELFENYCTESLNICASDKETLELKGFSEIQEFPEVINCLNNFGIVDIECMTTTDHQSMYKDLLIRIKKTHSNHYLRNKEIEIKKMLEFEF